MITRCLIFLTLLIPCYTSLPAQAKSSASWSDYIFLGDCQLSSDPAESWEFSWPIVCLKAEASTSLLLRARSPEKNMTLNLLNGYAGIHLKSWLSLHGKARRKRLFLINSASESVAADGAITEALFLAVGNQALHRYRLYLGKLKMPFGINHSPVPDIHRVALKTERYWKYPDFVAALTFDNLVDAIFEVAVATDQIPHYHDSENVQLTTIENTEALSARVSFDISALEGTRFMVFGYAEKTGQRRFGAGFINRTIRGDLTAFEWVRWRDTPDGKTHGIQQIFRINYEGVFATNYRPIFEYESEERTYRLVTFGQDFKVSEYGLARMSGSYYYDDRSDRDTNFWFMTVGLKLEL